MRTRLIVGVSRLKSVVRNRDRKKIGLRLTMEEVRLGGPGREFRERLGRGDCRTSAIFLFDTKSDATRSHFSHLHHRTFSSVAFWCESRVQPQPTLITLARPSLFRIISPSVHRPRYLLPVTCYLLPVPSRLSLVVCSLFCIDDPVRHQTRVDRLFALPASRGPCHLKRGFAAAFRLPLPPHILPATRDPVYIIRQKKRPEHNTLQALGTTATLHT